MYSDTTWTAEDKRKALESFECIYVLVTLQYTLLYLKEAAVKLQGPSQDVSSGFGLIEQCWLELSSVRTSVGEYSHRIFDHSSRIAAASGIIATMPRVTQKQRHQPNPESTSAQDCFNFK